MYLSTNYLISFFSRPSLVLCGLFVASPFSPSHSFFFFFHFHTFFSSNAPSYVRLHLCNCLHVNDLYESRFRLFFLYQFCQVKIRDIGEIVIVLLLLEQLKYTHARTVSSNYFVCLVLFFFSLLRIRVFLVYAVEIDLQRDGSMDAFFLPKLNVLLLKRHISICFGST